MKGVGFGENMHKLKPGFRVFKNLGNADFSQYQQQASIGEIIHLNKCGTVGLAMINLEALFSHQGDFVVLNSPKVVVDENSVTENTDSESRGDEIVRFISTFKPFWFEGLDLKTNIKI